MLEIGINPILLSFGPFVLGWHGVFAVLGVLLGVYLVGRWAPQYGIPSEVVYSVSVWAIIGGILGAKLAHVVDDWRFYLHNPLLALAVWRGGIAIWGGVLGGFLGAYIYCRVNKIPWRRLADITAPAMLLAQAVGRIGDIINGEHFAEPTTLPWGFVYTHPSIQALYQNSGFSPFIPTHPAVFYELIWNVIAFALIWWVLRKRLRPEGMLFAAYLGLYAFGRFFVSFFREDRDWIGDLNEAQIISLAVLMIVIPLLGFRSRIHGFGTKQTILGPGNQQAQIGRASGTRPSFGNRRKR